MVWNIVSTNDYAMIFGIARRNEDTMEMMRIEITVWKMVRGLQYAVWISNFQAR